MKKEWFVKTLALGIVVLFVAVTIATYISIVSQNIKSHKRMIK